MSINKVCISGNLTRDPELRQTSGGTAVLSFGIAVNDRVKNSNGEWVDSPNFIDCTLFGQRATSLQTILHKGFKVCIDGKLKYSQWENNGQKRSKIEVIVDNLDFMQAKQQAPQATAPAPVVNNPVIEAATNAAVAAGVNPQTNGNQPVQIEATYGTEDIPF